jgi:hypothetical protein
VLWAVLDSSKAVTVTAMDTIDPKGRQSVYTGQTVDKVPDGYGELTVVEEGPNKGNVSKGQFKHGKLHGDGAWKCATSGSAYDGAWANGKFHGAGSYAWADGSKYVGEFADDKFHGRGTKFAAGGAEEYAGLWWMDEPADLEN